MSEENETQNTLITIPEDKLEDMLCRAAEKGALKALSDVGLDGENAEEDIKALRSLLQGLRLAKKTAWQTFIRILTASLLAALMAGIAMKLKIFGNS